MPNLTRRQLLAGTAAVAASATAARASAATQAAALPSPGASGIEHIVFLCMEHRSFDHYLGWLPGAAGRQAGLSYRDDHGVPHPTHHLTERQGCGSTTPTTPTKALAFSSWAGSSTASARATTTTSPSATTPPRTCRSTDSSCTSPRSSTTGSPRRSAPPTPNRFYTHAARTDRIDNTMRLTSMPTIWDRLAAAGVPATYYFSDLPFLALWGEKYLPISKPVGSFFTKTASGTLPQLSYLDPFFLGEDQGGSNDDHPHADIHRGQALVSDVANAIAQSPLWSKTALVITYDEWGGFFDHVKPPRFPDDHLTGPGEYDHGQTGFRVPAFVFSPFARRGGIDHGVYDHTSMLRFVEWRFELKPLSARDRSARNLALAMDFGKPNPSVPVLPMVLDPGPHLCGSPEVGWRRRTPSGSSSETSRTGPPGDTSPERRHEPESAAFSVPGSLAHLAGRGLLSLVVQ